MDKKDSVRLKHILDSAKAALSYVQNKKRSDLDHDRMLLSALIRELEIIGEASNYLSSGAKKKHSTIPWKEIISMRNRLIHAYFDINHDLLWLTVTEDLPILILQLESE